MKTCNNCILPENYSGIKINENGSCNYCNQNNEISYLGEEHLIEDVIKIKQQNKNKDYDCIVGFSGGRDSTYLLWYTVNVLKLRPIAVFSDSGLNPKQTVANVVEITDRLGVKLVIKKHNYLLKSIKYSLTSWVNKPESATLVNLCNGCRYGIYESINEEAEKRGINLVLAGGTPFEKGLFKKNLISLKQNNHFSFLFNYSKLVLKNPRLVLNYHFLKMQFLEYYTMKSGYISSRRKGEVTIISPFTKYIHWDEEIIDATIENVLNWKKNPELNSNYRGDCYVGIIRQMLYDIMLGYNDKEDHLSWLIRDGQISRNDAMDRIKEEKEISFNTIINSFERVGVDYNNFVYEFKKNVLKNKNAIFKEMTKLKTHESPTFNHTA